MTLAREMTTVASFVARHFLRLKHPILSIRLITNLTASATSRTKHLVHQVIIPWDRDLKSLQRSTLYNVISFIFFIAVVARINFLFLPEIKQL